MSIHSKFMFDTVFGAEAEETGPPEPTFSQAELDAVRAAGMAEGVSEGRKQAAAEFAAGADKRIGQLVAQLASLTQTLAQHRAQITAEATEIAMVSAALLCDALIAREPHAELVALFEDCISHLGEAPHVVVRVPGGDLEALREQLKTHAELHGCTGRIVVLNEDGMDRGDCRIEWADGGVTRDGRTLRQTLRRLVESRYPPGWNAVMPDHDEDIPGAGAIGDEAMAAAAAKERDDER